MAGFALKFFEIFPKTDYVPQMGNYRFREVRQIKKFGISPMFIKWMAK